MRYQRCNREEGKYPVVVRRGFPSIDRSLGHMLILSIRGVTDMAILNGKWTTVSKIWYLGETTVTICLMDGLLC